MSSIFRLGALRADVAEMLTEQVQFRGLLLQMVRRDLVLRYKQTVMGFGWALFLRLASTAFFSVIFTRVAPLETGMPYALYAWALRRVNQRDRRPGIFYFHPWEVDPDQPRIGGASLRSRFRHYVNLDTMESRLRRLLSEFRWGRMDEVFPVA